MAKDKFRELEISFKEALEEAKKLILESEDIEDYLRSMADNYTPVYNWELLEVTLDNFELGFVEEGFDFGDIYDVIRWNICMHLESIAHEWWHEQEQ